MCRKNSDIASCYSKSWRHLKCIFKKSPRTQLPVACLSFPGDVFCDPTPAGASLRPQPRPHFIGVRSWNCKAVTDACAMSLCPSHDAITKVRLPQRKNEDRVEIQTHTRSKSHMAKAKVTHWHGIKWAKCSSSTLFSPVDQMLGIYFMISPTN